MCLLGTISHTLCWRIDCLGISDGLFRISVWVLIRLLFQCSDEPLRILVFRLWGVFLSRLIILSVTASVHEKFFENFSISNAAVFLAIREETIIAYAVLGKEFRVFINHRLWLKFIRHLGNKALRLILINKIRSPGIQRRKFLRHLSGLLSRRMLDRWCKIWWKGLNIQIYFHRRHSWELFRLVFRKIH